MTLESVIEQNHRLVDEKTSQMILSRVGKQDFINNNAHLMSIIREVRNTVNTNKDQAEALQFKYDNLDSLFVSKAEFEKYKMEQAEFHLKTNEKIAKLKDFVSFDGSETDSRDDQSLSDMPANKDIEETSRSNASGERSLRDKNMSRVSLFDASKQPKERKGNESPLNIIKVALQHEQQSSINEVFESSADKLAESPRKHLMIHEPNTPAVRIDPAQNNFRISLETD